jgi:predicted transcriptional regulator
MLGTDPRVGLQLSSFKGRLITSSQMEEHLEEIINKIQEDNINEEGSDVESSVEELFSSKNHE